MRPSATASAARVRAIDWLRGAAVLVMIQTHALSLLRPELRAGEWFARLQWVDGLVAPSFLFAAGFSLSLVQCRTALAAGGSTGRWQRIRRTLRRLFEVLFVATLLNWIFFPLRQEPKWLLRIDILQCIGLSLLLALPLTAGLAARPRLLRLVALGLSLGAFAVAPLCEPLRGPLGHLLSARTELHSAFPLLPWAGHVYLGASAGACAASGTQRELWLWLSGIVLLGLVCWALTPQLSAAYPPHEFWVTNPANSARRFTQVGGAALLLLGLERLRGARATPGWVRLLEVFGSSSLAGYFWHECLLFARVRGVSYHALFGDRVSWGVYGLLLLSLIGLTFALTWLTDRVYRAVDARL
jgi:uncharacterized membrane protein